MLNKYVGQSEENIRLLFADAEAEYKERGDESDLHIIIFDEIDSICKARPHPYSSPCLACPAPSICKARSRPRDPAPNARPRHPAPAPCPCTLPLHPAATHPLTGRPRAVRRAAAAPTARA